MANVDLPGRCPDCRSKIFSVSNLSLKYECGKEIAFENAEIINKSKYCEQLVAKQKEVVPQ